MRAVSAISLVIVLGLLLAERYLSLRLTDLVVVCAAVWMLTAPCSIAPFMVSILRRLRWSLARPQPRPSPPSLARLAKALGTPILSPTMVVDIDKPNAWTDGTTLFITRGFEPFLETADGEAILAHELAHAKLQHPIKYGLLLMAVAFISLLFGVQFSAFHDALAVAMTLFAFLTLGALVFPVASRRMEHDANAEACKVVDPAVLIRAIKALKPREQWGLESDSHPSVEARIHRIRSLQQVQDNHVVGG